jgi:hypothetical protein
MEQPLHAVLDAFVIRWSLRGRFAAQLDEFFEIGTALVADDGQAGRDVQDQAFKPGGVLPGEKACHPAAEGFAAEAHALEAEAVDQFGEVLHQD